MLSKIVIGSDHFGLPLKNQLRDYLREQGYEVDDIGTNSSDPVDYPDIAVQLALEISVRNYERGILVCGTGAGMAIVANKVPNVRAVAVYDPYTAERAKASNNAQVITLGSQVMGVEVAMKLVDIWLRAEFKGGRSAPKVKKMDDIDQKYRAQMGSD
jgi:ribose 5-phosphate isomerase B